MTNSYDKSSLSSLPKKTLTIRNRFGYTVCMIKSFKHKGLELFFKTGNTSKIQIKHKQKLRHILFMLDNAVELTELNLPSFRLHRLKGKRSEFYSIKVSGNWRITFKFFDSNAEIVNYEDYH